ncbi:hypothetical protein D3C86_1554300 [compost metagenome]
MIWLTETPNSAGTISSMIRRTPSSRRTLGVGSNLIRARNGNWNSNWATPAISTPQARAMIGCSKYGVR